MEFLENSLTYEQYDKLRTSVGWNNFPEEQAKITLVNSAHILSVMENGRAVAMARLIGDGMYYVIVDVVVDPVYQKKGIGTTLINKMLQYIENNLPIEGRISVQLIAEKGKESFYQQFGFKMIPHEYCGSGMQKVIYNKQDK